MYDLGWSDSHASLDDRSDSGLMELIYSAKMMEAVCGCTNLEELILYSYNPFPGSPDIVFSSLPVNLATYCKRQLPFEHRRRTAAPHKSEATKTRALYGTCRAGMQPRLEICLNLKSLEHASSYKHEKQTYIFNA